MVVPKMGEQMSATYRAALVVAVLSALSVVPASAHYKVIYSFCSNCKLGINPTSLTMDGHGNLFGTAIAGGYQYCGDERPDGCGTIFELKRRKSGQYSYVMLYQFQNGNDTA
jgi:hypothetical protein